MACTVAFALPVVSAVVLRFFFPRPSPFFAFRAASCCIGLLVRLPSLFWPPSVVRTSTNGVAAAAQPPCVSLVPDIQRQQPFCLLSSFSSLSLSFCSFFFRCSVSRLPLVLLAIPAISAPPFSRFPLPLFLPFSSHLPYFLALLSAPVLGLPSLLLFLRCLAFHSIPSLFYSFCSTSSLSPFSRSASPPSVAAFLPFLSFLLWCSRLPSFRRSPLVRRVCRVLDSPVVVGVA